MRAKFIFISVTILLLAGLRELFAGELENSLLRVGVSETGVLTVTDKRSGEIWEQTALSRVVVYGMSELPQGGIELKLGLEGVRKSGKTEAAPFVMRIGLEGEKAEIVATFTPYQSVSELDWQLVKYPFAFLPPQGENPSILYPHGTGMLLPAQTDAPGFLKLPSGALYGGTLSYLAGLGYVNMTSGVGMMCINEDIASAQMFWAELPARGRKYYAFSMGWLADRYRIERSYTMRWQFSDQGGYVSMAGMYRDWSDRQGWSKSLKTKAAECEHVDKLVGAPIFWLYGSVQGMSRAVDKLISAKVKHCAFGLDDIYEVLASASKSELKERRALVGKVVEAGYIAYHYDNYRDAFKRDPAEPVWHQRNWDAYPHDIVLMENGNMLSPGFTQHCGVITPDAFMKYACSHIPEDNERYPWNARFIDCVGSCGFTEGVDWREGREHSTIYYTREKREELMRYSCEIGHLTATECGLDYLMPYTHWYDGAMSLVSFTNVPAGAFTFQGTSTDGSTTRVEVSDDIPMNGTTHFSVSESVRYRIPFWFLVYHDCAVGTWRWETGMNQPPEQWPRKLLLNILSGTPPLYRMNSDQFFEIQKPWLETYRMTEEWLRKVGYAKMILHKFVSDDKYVQLSLFEGGAGVVVNMGTSAYRLSNGVELPAQSYAFFDSGLDDKGMPQAMSQSVKIEF